MIMITTILILAIPSALKCNKEVPTLRKMKDPNKEPQKLGEQKLFPMPSSSIAKNSKGNYSHLKNDTP